MDGKIRTVSTFSSSSNDKDSTQVSVGSKVTLEQSILDTTEKSQIYDVILVDATEGGVARQEEVFPDGGLRAWLVVLGGSCACFASVGYLNSWGIFQKYYKDTLLSQYPPSTIAWIGSVQFALLFLPGLVAGRLFDLGYYRIIFLSSSLLLVVATFLVAQCTQYWHLLLCQGFATGIACGGLFAPSLAIISHWFKHKRGRALGYVAIGTSVGGAVLPTITKSLLSAVGFAWTMRIIACILLFVLTICNLTMKTRLPPVNVKGGLLNLAAFKSAPYTLYCLSSFVNFLGFYTLLTYVNVSATHLGSSPQLAFYFVSFANAGSLFGRLTSGLVADRTGPLNIMVPSAFVTGILTYAWPFTRSSTGLIFVTVIYGFATGVYVSLLSNPIMNFGGEGDMGRRIGMYMSITALGAVAGPPISGAISSRTGSFEAVGFYAGSTMMLSVVLMMASRYFALGRQWRGKM